MKWIDKLFKVVTSLVMVLLILVFNFQTYFADSEAINSVVNVLGIDNNYNDSTLKQIEVLVKSSYSGEQNIKIGEYISIYNAEDENLFFVYPVYVGDICKYLAEVSLDGFATLTDNVSIIDKIKGLPEGEYLLYIENGKLYAENNTRQIFIKYLGFISDDTISEFQNYSFEDKVIYLRNIYGEMKEFDSVNINSEKSIFTFYNQNNNLRSVVTGNDGSLITYKCNITNFVTQGNYGLCWSAASATIINYKTGSSINAMYLADRYHIGYNDGATIYQIQTCLTGFGLPYNVLNSKIQWSQIKSNINADKPFVIGLTNSSVAHTLTGYGYGCISRDTVAASRTIYAWDPNGYKISFLDNSSSAIVTSGYLFTWSSSVY